MLRISAAAVVLTLLCVGCATTVGSSENQQMTSDDVIALAKKGVSDNVIINQIRATGSTFHLTNDDLVALKDAGVSDKVASVMLNTTGKRRSRDYDYAPYYGNPYWYGSFSWFSPFYSYYPYHWGPRMHPDYSYYHYRPRVRR